MKEVLAILLGLLTLAGACHAVEAGPLYVLTVAAMDPNGPVWADPNLIDGSLLWISADVNDPNALPVWQVTAGKKNFRGTWSDPDGDPVVVACTDPNWTVTMDDVAGYYTLAGELLPGDHYIGVTITDSPPPTRQPISVKYTLVVRATWAENRPPRLHPIAE